MAAGRRDASVDRHYETHPARIWYQQDALLIGEPAQPTAQLGVRTAVLDDNDP